MPNTLHGLLVVVGKKMGDYVSNVCYRTSLLLSHVPHRFFKPANKELYAEEIYGLAKAFGLKPSQLFEYFYGDGDRPVVGID